MNLLIYGAGGLAKEVYDIVARSTPDKYEEIIFIDDYADESRFYLSESIHFESILKRYDSSELEGVVAVGEPQYRELLTKKFENAGVRLATIIDNTSVVSPTAFIDDGCIICEYCTVHSNVHIGKSALIQPYCCVGHDIDFGDYSVMSATCTPGGGSSFGKRVYMGMNASSKEKIQIGNDVIIGMGAAVFKDIPDGMTVIGNPARITKGNDEHKVFS